MNNEDQRQAVSIIASLSGQLIGVSLGMIALEGAFFTFAIDKKQCGIVFWLATLFAFFAFIASIIYGGKGITALYKNGSNGKWNITFGDTKFRRQTGWCIIGLLVFLVASIVSWKDKPPQDELFEKKITSILAILDKQTAINQQNINQASSKLFIELSQAKQDIAKLQKEVQNLKSTHESSDTTTKETPK